jgi:hypothetical protein
MEQELHEIAIRQLALEIGAPPNAVHLTSKTWRHDPTGKTPERKNPDYMNPRRSNH